MNDTDLELTGTILHLQRLSTEDGPGLRTTVFFKGCPLRCAWCHNPESLLLKPEVQWIGNRCIGCNSCVEACEHNALTRTESGIERDRAVCVVCGKCVDACPSGAMEMLGEEVSVEELVKELIKDRAYFEKSGGGVTLSGGQRQRLALARAFLTDPRILMLDDSTSAIDSATEDKIQRAIYAAAKGRTTFIITHRLSQIRWADLILVDYKPFTDMTVDNFPWHVVFGFQNGMVTTTIAAGKILMRDRKVVVVDEDAVIQEAKQISTSVWKKYQELF